MLRSMIINSAFYVPEDCFQRNDDLETDDENLQLLCSFIAQKRLIVESKRLIKNFKMRYCKFLLLQYFLRFNQIYENMSFPIFVFL